MATIKIPDDRGNVVKVTINGRTWTFEAGTTLEVPDEIEALLIHKGLIEPRGEEPKAQAVIVTVKEEEDSFVAETTYDELSNVVDGATPVWIILPERFSSDAILVAARMKTDEFLHLSGTVVDPNGLLTAVDIWLDPSHEHDGTYIEQYELLAKEVDGGGK